MRILLILAAAPGDPLRRNDPFMPLALPLLAASAPGHEYRFVDMLAGEDPPYDEPFDLVGISARITAEKTAFGIADRYRDRKITVVLGGPQVSSSPFSALEHADAVVVGEGEALWPVLLGDLAPGGTLKRFYVASPEPFDARGHSLHQIRAFPDLSSIPSAIAERRLYSRRYVFDTVFASRGCAVDCDFCSVSRLFGKETRLRPVADVVREIESFKGFYYLLDDTVFGRPHTYDYYLALYEAIGALPGKRLWTGQANLDAAATEKGRQVIRAAARAGLVYAAIGIESIQPEVLSRSGTIRKSGAAGSETVVAGMKERIAFLQDQGIAVSGWFTLGYEEDTLETFQRTYEFCRETQILPVLCPLEALPGTRLHGRLEREGRLDSGKAINIVHPSLTDQDILGEVRRLTQEGFSLASILGRTRFYAGKFRAAAGPGARVGDVIKKTIFVFVLQTKMKKGVVGLANASGGGATA